MTANAQAKLKLLHIHKMLMEETDAEHGLTMADILERLAAEGITAERKSIYRDIKLLREIGVDVRKYERNPVEYAIEHRGFSLAELMLLVDAVQSSRFITQKQCNLLVGNIKSLAAETSAHCWTSESTWRGASSRRTTACSPPSTSSTRPCASGRRCRSSTTSTVATERRWCSTTASPTCSRP